MIKKLLFEFVLILTLVSIAWADQPVKTDAPRNLTIISVEPLKDEIYAVVSIEFPKAWTDPQFALEVNGNAARMRQRSGGFSGDRATADFLFNPGKTEKQSVTVKTVIDGKRVEAKSSFEWKPGPFIAVIGHTGDREIIVAREKLTVAAVNVTGVKMFFNGKEVRSRPSAGDIQTLSFDPAWRKGKNVLTVNADKLDGGIIAKNFTFFDLGDGGALPPGQTALLLYGQEGSKSGPFYDVRIEGDAIAALRDSRVRRNLIDKDGWIVSEVWLARELRAQKEGMSKVRIFVKPHFLQKMELEKEFSITVADR